MSEASDRANTATAQSSSQQERDVQSGFERGTYLGVLQVLGNGAGFIRSARAGYLPSDSDIYVSQKIVGRWQLRSGDEISGTAGKAPGNGKSPPLRNLPGRGERTAFEGGDLRPHGTAAGPSRRGFDSGPRGLCCTQRPFSAYGFTESHPPATARAGSLARAR